MTTQDIEKGIDLTGLVTVTASELNQLVDTARSAADKGLIITTTDYALNAPIVPDPDTVIDGITPIWWKRYIWTRNPFDNTGTINAYVWNLSKTPDATFLKWESVKVDITTLTALIATAQARADSAYTLATTANNSATIGIANAATAQAKADLAKTTADTANTNLATFEGVVGSGLEPIVAGKYQILYNNVLNAPLASRLYNYINRHSILTQAQANPFVETAWVGIDLTTYLTNFVLSPGHADMAAIIQVQLYCELPTGHGFTAAILKAWFTNDNAQTDANSRNIFAQLLKAADPDEGNACVQTQFIVPISAAGLIYWRWFGQQSYNNLIQIDLLGFTDNGLLHL